MAEATGNYYIGPMGNIYCKSGQPYLPGMDSAVMELVQRVKPVLRLRPDRKGKGKEKAVRMPPDEPNHPPPKKSLWVDAHIIRTLQKATYSN